MLWVVGGLLILIGVAMCFFGYRLFRIWLTVAGLFAGAAAGAYIGAAYLGGGAWPVILAIVLGLLFAAGAYFVYRLGVILTGAALGAALAGLVTSVFGPIAVLALLIGAVVGATLSSIFLKPYIIVGSAFNGAYFMGVGLQTLLTMQTAAVDKLLSPMTSLPWYILIAVLALTVLGAIVQFRANKGRELNTGKPTKSKNEQ